jgi:hypothetical protein
VAQNVEGGSGVLLSSDKARASVWSKMIDVKSDAVEI